MTVILQTSISISSYVKALLTPLAELDLQLTIWVNLISHYFMII